ncbi:MAG: tRNA preQ1(34) S-adenosylmethionine ribosyltransferase-isomerase QueA [Candidatus Omnitrophota bacterium]|nr:tRNA preQ1(34) S-adenosylmethionine ribosyltransferase-isomerase QueA [Candidatus Omnitrophota bacterium]
MLTLSDFDYTLPQELIAEYPVRERTQARLLRVERGSGELSHSRFSELSQFLKAGDVLVLNNTKVFPARIFGRKSTGAKVEVVLLERAEGRSFEALVKPSGRIRKGSHIQFGENGSRMEAEVTDEAREGSGVRSLEFRDANFRECLEQIGHMALPPYIRRADTPEDRENYQTVFAEKEGAVAAPTAGLHFDCDLLSQLWGLGVEIVFVTLHVGYGSFQPVVVEDVSSHRMFAEYFEVSEETAACLNRARESGRRIIACGTTSARALESAVGEDGRLKAKKEKTRLFVYPPYEFRCVDGLITNFHLPKSTLLLLVSAFVGREKLFNAYEVAIRERYRFYSYGDAMLIL